MGVALGLTFALLALAPDNSPSRPLVLHVSPFAEKCVRRAIALALAKLAAPGCAEVYKDFQLSGGGTPQTVLDQMGIEPAQLVEQLVFFDGSADHVCRQGRAMLTTTPGSHVIFVCPGFTRLDLQNPHLAASLIIHESLHVLGLGEDPPTSSEITQHVERRCWRVGN